MSNPIGTLETDIFRKKIKEKYPYLKEKEIKNFAKTLKHIGIKTEQGLNKYLNPSLKDFNHPFEMKDLEKGVNILLEHLDSGKKIVFYGDYDADGVTTTSLFVKVLRDLGYDNIDWFLPNRHIEGYSVHPKRVQEFIEKYDLIITGDNGIKEIETLHNLPIPVIVTDHHEPFVTTDEKDVEKYKGIAKIVKKDGKIMAIPDVEAVINPKRIDCGYKNKNLSGVAVVFKLLQGLFIKKKLSQKDLMNYLDIVAVGLVADVVPQIDEENQDCEVRLMTILGLQKMNQSPNTWTRSMLNVSGKDLVTFNDLGFFIGPRLNAPGRLNSAELAAEFLLEEDSELSMNLALELEEKNTERKELQERAIQSTKKQGITAKDKIAVVRLDKEFHSGVTGLVASSLTTELNVPSIVFCEKEIDGELFLTGSCRSIEGVNILSILQNIDREIGIYKYGGHELAAGLTIRETEFEDFKRKAIELAKDIKIPDELIYEIEIPLHELTYNLVVFLEQTYQSIRLCSKGNRFYSPPTIKKNNPNWVDLFLESNGHTMIGTMWKKGGELVNEYVLNNPKTIDVVYIPSLWNNKINITIENYKFIP